MNLKLGSPIQETSCSHGQDDTFRGLVSVETKITITGTATTHIQPQSHALTWCVQPDGASPPETVQIVRPQDHITITSPTGQTLFEGRISARFHLLDAIPVYREINGERTPPGGFLIYWTPEGVEPHTWLSWFTEKNRIALRRHSKALVPPEINDSSPT